jgi:hypothetical protein
MNKSEYIADNNMTIMHPALEFASTYWLVVLVIGVFSVVVYIFLSVFLIY